MSVPMERIYRELLAPGLFSRTSVLDELVTTIRYNCTSPRTDGASMEHVENGNLNNDFRTCLSRLMESGMTAHPRGTTTKEHLNYNISLFDPRNRIINFPDRKTNLKYLLGELVWYFSGSNKPE